jgi:geranylgeranyl pyrophosphate synthase
VWAGFFGGQKTMANTKKFNQQLVKAAGRAQTQVGDFFKSNDPWLRKILAAAAKPQGKQLRIRLTILSAQACGKSGPLVENIAAAWELFHYATLLHDDVIDHSDKRRHLPSLNAQFGNEVAVLVGDLLLTQVMKILVKKVPVDVQMLVAQTALQVCSGEIQEHQWVAKWNISETTYLNIIRKKTAALFSACCQTGARLGKGHPKAAEKLGKFGQAFGMAFQIQDDILDLMGTSQKSGKPVAMDLKEGRITLPIILGLKQLKGLQRKKLLKYIQMGDRKIMEIQRLIISQQVLPKALAKARMYVRQAQQALQDLPNTPAKQELIKLAELAVERDS